MMVLIGAGLIILLAVVIVALGYRGKAKAEQRHAELQQQRAVAAEAINNNRQQLDTALATLHETHRKETIDETNSAHRAKRSDFDNDWNDGARLHDAGTGADHASGATAADSTGASVDHVSRTDLSE